MSARCGRDAESKLSRDRCRHSAPTARSAKPKAASQSCPEPWLPSCSTGAEKLRASCCSSGQLSAMACSTGASTTFRTPSNKTCSNDLPYSTVRFLRHTDGAMWVAAWAAETSAQLGGSISQLCAQSSCMDFSDLQCSGGLSIVAGGGRSSEGGSAGSRSCIQVGELPPMPPFAVNFQGSGLANSTSGPKSNATPPRPSSFNSRKHGALERPSVPVFLFASRRSAALAPPASISRALAVALTHQEASRHSRRRHCTIASKAASVTCVLQMHRVRKNLHESAKATILRSDSLMTEAALKTSRLGALGAKLSMAASLICVLATWSSRSMEWLRARNGTSVICEQPDKSKDSRPKLNSNSAATSSVTISRQKARPKTLRSGAPFMTHPKSPSAVTCPHLPIESSSKPSKPASGGFHKAGAKAVSEIRVQPSRRKADRCSQFCSTSLTMRLSTCWQPRTSSTLKFGQEWPIVFSKHRRSCEHPSRQSRCVCRVSTYGSTLSLSAFLTTKTSSKASRANLCRTDSWANRTFLGPYLMSL
mmetsp:Transcript_100539/g.322659  ORF Transcript_100539/g.322659 Transcript_100539/m.322659 type:complete len:534 (+) Transcript_100539:741-2342(+)